MQPPRWLHTFSRLILGLAFFAGTWYTLYEVIDMRDAEQKIREVNGSMAIEGMPLTDDDKERLRVILRGEVSADEMVRQIVAKYRRAADGGHVRV